MSSPITTRTLQDCRNCGGGAPVDVHFCPQCSQILTIGRHGDYFAFWACLAGSIWTPPISSSAFAR